MAGNTWGSKMGSDTEKLATQRNWRANVPLGMRLACIMHSQPVLGQAREPRGYRRESTSRASLVNLTDSPAGGVEVNIGNLSMAAEVGIRYHLLLAQDHANHPADPEEKRKAQRADRGADERVDASESGGARVWERVAEYEALEVECRMHHRKVTLVLGLLHVREARGERQRVGVIERVAPADRVGRETALVDRQGAE